MAEELILYTQDISSDNIALHERPYAALLRRLCSAADTSTRQALEATLVTMESAAPPGLTGDLPAGNRVLFTGKLVLLRKALQSGRQRGSIEQLGFQSI